ncbi:MAG: PQQ-binding-like beta-propeller repeat protein [Verrucomicrobiales bacterium]|nr:PQQ-binding-like beta-propeller repeat protein [Verrucomicrobiales bacterium]
MNTNGNWIGRCFPTGLACSGLAWVLCGGLLLNAADWPQWRGPSFNGASSAKGLPSELKLDSNLVWKAPMPGVSGATPVVVGDRVFVSSLDASRNLMLLCLNLKTGEKLWERSSGIGSFSGQRNNTASPSPVTDGKHVFALYGTGDLAAFDVEGKPLWSRNLGKDYGKFAIMWIYGSSPLLYDGRLYVQVLQRNPRPNDYTHALDDREARESYLLCIDPTTGKDLWRHVRATDSTKESQESYTTPFPHEGAARREIVLVGGDHLSGHDPKTGDEFWRARLYEKRDDWYRIVPSAVSAEGLVFASGPKGQPLVGVKEGGQGNVTATHVAWTSKEGHTDWSTPLVYQGRLYVADGAKKTLACFNPKTGEKYWSGSLGVSETVWSSPTGADGKIYLLSERGTVVVLSAGDEFKILSKTELGDDQVRSSIVVVDGKVLVRTTQQLYCFGK